MDAALLQRAESAVARAREVANVAKRGVWGSSAGKAKVAGRIASLLPAHKTYVEPFVGSGAVLFVKQQADREIINDADADIAKAFRIIKGLREADIDRLSKKTWVGSRKTYDAIRKTNPSDRIDWLHKFLYESRFSYRKIRGSGYDSTAEGVEAGIIKRLRDRVDRLKGVEVHAGDYKPMISKFDSPSTVFFLDPPYVGYDGSVGERKFNEREFFDILKRIKGKFVLTYGLKGELPKLLKSEPRFKVRRFGIVGSTNKPTDIIVTNFEAKADWLEKKLSPSEQADFDRESALINENKRKPEASQRHKFKAARWTHPNGHPRCLTCGDEETMSGYCNSSTKIEEAVSDRFGELQAADPDFDTVKDWDRLLNRARNEVLSKQDDGFVPPKAAADAAELGLKLRGEFNRGGTDVGVARARDIKNRAALSLSTVRRMHSFFSRHGAQVDRRDPQWGNRADPSAQWIAWLLWGGDPGRDWAKGIAERNKIAVEVEQGDRLSKAIERLAGAVGMKVEQAEDRVVTVPGADSIISGDADLLLDTRKSHPVGSRLLLSGSDSFAHIELGKPEQVDLWKFAELSARHRVTDDQRKAAWPKARKLWAYPVQKVEITDPSVVEIELDDDEVRAFIEARDLAVAFAAAVPGFVERHKRFVDGDDLALLEGLPAVAGELQTVLKEVAHGDVGDVTEASAVMLALELLRNLATVEDKLPPSKARDAVRRGSKALKALQGLAKGEADLDPIDDAPEPAALDSVAVGGLTAEPVVLQPGAVTIVGGAARWDRAPGPVDVLLKGVSVDDARRAVQDDGVRFIEAGEFGPVADHAEVFDLVLVPRSSVEVSRLSVDKGDDVTLDLPAQRGKRPAVFQFRFKADSMRGDLLLQVDDSLVGWSIANHEVGKAHGVDDLKGARRMARRFDRAGNYFLKRWTDPRGLASIAKGRQSKAWLDVRGEQFEDGEFGEGIIVAVTEPDLRVEFGLQKAAVHEYHFSGDRSFEGRLIFKRVGDGWRSFWTDSLVPIVLSKRAVIEKLMPTRGYSAIPVSLEQVVPESLRYWDLDGDEALEARDALVADEFFTSENVAIVDGEFRRLTTKRYLDLGGAPDVSKARIPFALLLQEWHGSKGVTRKAWHIAIGGDEPRAFVAHSDPRTGEPATCRRRAMKSLDLLSFEGDVGPGEAIGGDVLNDTKATPSTLRRVDRGFVEVIEDRDDLMKVRFCGKLRGEFAVEPEEPGSDLWVLRSESKQVTINDRASSASLFAKRGDAFAYVECPACEAINLRRTGASKSIGGERYGVVECNDCGARFGVDVAVLNRGEVGDDLLINGAEPDDFSAYAVIKAVPVDDGVQLWTGDATDPSIDRDQLRPLARFEAMKIVKREVGEFITPSLLQLGIFVEPMLKGERLSLQKRGNRVAIFAQESTTIQTLIFDKGKFTREQAVQWAKDHDFKRTGVDETGESYRLRQREPGDFRQQTFRTITLTEGVKAVIGILKTAKADRSKSMPDVVDQLRRIGGDFVLDAVLTADGIEVVDALFVPSAGNITSKSQAARRLKAEQLLRGTDLSLVSTRVVRSEPELREALEWTGGAAVLKAADALYAVGDDAELWAACEVKVEHDPVRELMRDAMAKRIPLVKTDEERFVLGIVLEPNDGDNGAPLDPDTQSDIYSADDIRDAAHKFMEEFRNTGVMHRELANDRIKILESYIAPQDLKLGGSKIRKGTWLLAVRVVDDTLWSKVKTGELTGFSIGGSALRAPDKAAAA